MPLGLRVAKKLEAILFLLLSAKSDEELKEARERAKRLAALTGEQVTSLLAQEEEEEEPEQEAREGDLIRYLRRG